MHGQYGVVSGEHVHWTKPIKRGPVELRARIQAARSLFIGLTTAARRGRLMLRAYDPGRPDDNECKNRGAGAFLVEEELETALATLRPADGAGGGR